VDTSKEYILMCEKATEVQDTNKLKRIDPKCKCGEEYFLNSTDVFAIHSKDGYWYHSRFTEEYHGNATVMGYVRVPKDSFGCAVRGDLPKAFEYSEVIWLPTQDQLQNMVIDWECGQSLANICLHLLLFASGHPYSNDSFEKLWLGYVMKIKFNKVWNGTDWVEEKLE
jgi:hypothetical protein